MPFTLQTLTKKIEHIPNTVNRNLVNELYSYMTERDLSKNHKINNLKVIMSYADYLGAEISFHNINNKDQILSFLDSKKKDLEIDPDKRWVTTWNHYLNRLKLFFRWFHNRGEHIAKCDEIDTLDWKTPEFIKIKLKKTKRVSPYSESELWDKDDILLVTKYESYKRNKAILALLWDLDARPHEITLLKIRHISIKERYGEGEVPHQAKTGGGPILLTCSFPYVRDWLNEHPFKNEPESRLVCNLTTGAPINPEAIWTMMGQLRKRILRLLETGSIINVKERERLQHLINNKRWNPYCIRHSAITADSDFLPEYALKKKVRWSMNSKQGSRYIKRRMGNDLKQKILVYNGIVPPPEIERKPSVIVCPRCTLVNAVENKYCSACSYPLVPSAYDEIKLEEELKLRKLEEKHDDEMKKMDQKLENMMALIRQNPKLASVKPESLKSKLK
jgi:integrase/recombinase XerD